ncbi:glycoside hydrolase family 3 C-terminal domain-containing protein [Lipomyces starkeyi]
MTSLSSITKSSGDKVNPFLATVQSSKIDLEACKTYNVKVEFGSASRSKLATAIADIPGGGLRIGVTKTLEPEVEIEVARLFSPFRARLTLVDAVLDANTVVVVQSGTPVEMPWISVVEAWYSGSETGNGIAFIIFGDLNSSGRLPLSFPPNPIEDIYIGYRYYEAVEKEVLFPFGHGLSHSTFEFLDLRGSRPSLCSPAPPIYQPAHKEIKAFSKVDLAAGQSKAVEIVLDIKRITTFRDEMEKAWIREKNTYEVLVGSSSADIKLSAQFETEKTIWWNGL